VVAPGTPGGAAAAASAAMAGPLPRSPRASVWLLSGGQDHEVRVWDVGTAACLAVLGHHCAPVTTLRVCGPQIASLATGDGLAVFVREPFDAAEHAARGGGGGPPDGGGEDGAGPAGGAGPGPPRASASTVLPGMSGRGLAPERRRPGRRGVLGVRVEVEAARGEWKAALGLEEVLSLLDGVSVNFAAALAMDRKGLGLGTQTGEVFLYDYSRH